MNELIFEEESFRIRGAIFEVYKEMGCGFLEAVYHECLQSEFAKLNIPFNSQPELKLKYKDLQLNQTYKPDFICFDKIILEIKAVVSLNDDHRAQIHNYLKATKIKLGILANFGHFPKVEIERIVK